VYVAGGHAVVAGAGAVVAGAGAVVAGAAVGAAVQVEDVAAAGLAEAFPVAADRHEASSGEASQVGTRCVAGTHGALLGAVSAATDELRVVEACEVVASPAVAHRAGGGDAVRLLDAAASEGAAGEPVG